MSDEVFHYRNGRCSVEGEVRVLSDGRVRIEPDGSDGSIGMSGELSPLDALDLARLILRRMQPELARRYPPPDDHDDYPGLP